MSEIAIICCLVVQTAVGVLVGASVTKYLLFKGIRDGRIRIGERGKLFFVED